jgi:hypothetical protein
MNNLVGKHRKSTSKEEVEIATNWIFGKLTTKDLMTKTNKTSANKAAEWVAQTLRLFVEDGGVIMLMGENK